VTGGNGLARDAIDAVYQTGRIACIAGKPDSHMFRGTALSQVVISSPRCAL